jgi:hypothetical protein
MIFIRASKRRRYMNVPALLLALLIVGGSGPVPAAGLSPVPPSFFGITVNSSVTKWPVPVAFGTAGKTASGSTTGGTYWAALEPSNGTFDWTPMDNLVAAAEAAGATTVMYTFFETPQWASSDPSQTCSATQKAGIYGCAAPPKSMGDWDSFVAALVTRYKGQVRYYELWNEPNVPTEFSGTVQQMVGMAQHAYGIIKSIDPAATVLAPGVSVAGVEPYSSGCPSSQCWLAEYLQAGGGQYADGVAFHGKTCLSDQPVCVQEGIACPTTELEACAGTALMSQVDDVRAIMATHGLSGKPLVDTEGGYSDEVGQKNLWPTVDQQAAFVSRFFIVQASQGIQVAVYFSWLVNPSQSLMGFGTAAAEPSTDQAYAQTRSWILGSTFDGPCSLSGGVWTCGLISAQGQEGLLVWADTNSTATSYSPPSRFTEYQDLGGATHQVSPGSSIRVDEEPVLLEGSPTITTSSAIGSSTSSAAPEFPAPMVALIALACLAFVSLIAGNGDHRQRREHPVAGFGGAQAFASLNRQPSRQVTLSR